MPQNRPQPPMDSALSMTVDSDPLAVRAALEKLVAGLSARGVSPQALISVELVLAEVLNNVVEHAYARTDGPIEITLNHEGVVLHCLIRDRGAGMPDGVLPNGAQSNLNGPTDALPEGGFGWFLIRKLAEGIAYRRAGDQNELAFRIRIDPAPEAPVRPAASRP